MKNKTLVWVGIASAVLITGGLIWWKMSNKTGETDENKVDTDENKPKDTDENKPKEEVKPTPTPTPSYPATPFKNKTEGNAFRAWMMKNHNDWRFVNGDILDSSGDYNGNTIRKAYQDYGAEYIKATTPVGFIPPFAKDDVVYINPNKPSVGVSSFPQAGYGLGGVWKKDLLDKPLGKYVQATKGGKYNVFSKIVLSTDYKTFGGTPVKAVGKEVYVLDQDISKSPY